MAESIYASKTTRRVVAYSDYSYDPDVVAWNDENVNPEDENEVSSLSSSSSAAEKSSYYRSIIQQKNGFGGLRNQQQNKNYRTATTHRKGGEDPPEENLDGEQHHSLPLYHPNMATSSSPSKSMSSASRARQERAAKLNLMTIAATSGQRRRNGRSDRGSRSSPSKSPNKSIHNDVNVSISSSEVESFSVLDESMDEPLAQVRTKSPQKQQQHRHGFGDDILNDTQEVDEQDEEYLQTTLSMASSSSSFYTYNNSNTYTIDINSNNAMNDDNDEYPTDVVYWVGKDSTMMDKLKYNMNRLYYGTKSVFTTKHITSENLFDTSTTIGVGDEAKMIPVQIYTPTAGDLSSYRVKTIGNMHDHDMYNQGNRMKHSSTSYGKLIQFIDSKWSWISFMIMLSIAFCLFGYAIHNDKHNTKVNQQQFQRQHGGDEWSFYSDGSIHNDGHTNSKLQSHYDEYYDYIMSNHDGGNRKNNYNDLSPKEAPLEYFNGPTIITVRIHPAPEPSPTRPNPIRPISTTTTSTPIHD